MSGETPKTPLDAFDYQLPEESIAQVPIEPRSAARLLVAIEPDGGVEHLHVTDLPSLLGVGDVLVVNETRVRKARLHLHKETGGRVEVLLLAPHRPGAPDEWEALVRPARRLRPGTLLYAGDTDPASPVVEVGRPLEDGTRLIRVLDPAATDRHGSVPLPPYIHEELHDPERYQTVYARAESSAAAPTAGLHFTTELLEQCRAAGARIETIELAVGLDTFRPISADYIEDHVMHSERYRVPQSTIEACHQARRVIAVGTTALRALETVAAGGALEGSTELYVHGGYRFGLVDVLMTNFHLPRSSLLVLVEAFAGPRWRSLYQLALEKRYRFLSFGDAMLLGRPKS